jgi:hypothetical protein
VPNIYAAGDVIGFPALASTSMEQGRVAVCHAFGFKFKQRVASMLPMGIYTIPEISAAGETEESCKEKKIDYCVGRALYANNAQGHIIGDTAGMLKLVFARADKKLLGVSIIGESATELIHVGMAVLDHNETTCGATIRWRRAAGPCSESHTGPQAWSTDSRFWDPRFIGPALTPDHAHFTSPVQLSYCDCGTPSAKPGEGRPTNSRFHEALFQHPRLFTTAINRLRR